MAFVWYMIAAFAEIAGCFAFWAWTQLDKSALWLVPGMVGLAVFDRVLTRADSAEAARANAASGGVNIASSMRWMCLVELLWPDREERRRSCFPPYRQRGGLVAATKLRGS